MADSKKLHEAENINVPKPDTYAAQLEQAVANINPDYKYDFAADQLYQDYKKGYMTEADKMRNDVIAAGKQLTGARPDTYVDSSANQQYQAYLAEINRLAPTFENLAYARHQMEQEQALRNAQLLGQLRESEYNRYRDELGDARNFRNYALGNYKYDVGLENERDKVAMNAAAANHDYMYRFWQDRFDTRAKEQAAAEAASSGGSGRGGSGGSGYGYGGYDYSQEELVPSLYSTYDQDYSSVQREGASYMSTEGRKELEAQLIEDGYTKEQARQIAAARQRLYNKS